MAKRAKHLSTLWPWAWRCCTGQQHVCCTGLTFKRRMASLHSSCTSQASLNSSAAAYQVNLSFVFCVTRPHSSTGPSYLAQRSVFLQHWHAHQRKNTRVQTIGHTHFISTSVRPQCLCTQARDATAEFAATAASDSVP